MAKQSAHIKIVKSKKSGVQAKTKTSKNKKSKNYKKPYKGQGR